MGWIHIMERGGEDVQRFEESLKMAKAGIKEACEIFEDMKDQFSERGSYGERYNQRGSYGERSYYRSRDGYSGREWDDMDERRDRMGRYR